MKLSFVISILLALLMRGDAYAQEANQKDAEGRKYGLWIRCNPVGHFIHNPGECQYGRYEKDRKISSWYYSRLGGTLKRREVYSVKDIYCDSFQVENFHLNNILESSGYEKIVTIDSALVIDPETGDDTYKTIEVHRKNGLWSFYDDTGKLIKTILYKDDKEVSVK